ncbi:hypothetical protein KM043_001612 [Ampulex compressa]|nr:hypothetical protein KM043_001612 [Ampulex compressa]
MPANRGPIGAKARLRRRDRAIIARLEGSSEMSGVEGSPGLASSAPRCPRGPLARIALAPGVPEATPVAKRFRQCRWGAPVRPEAMKRSSNFDRKAGATSRDDRWVNDEGLVLESGPRSAESMAARSRRFCSFDPNSPTVLRLSAAPWRRSFAERKSWEKRETGLGKSIEARKERPAHPVFSSRERRKDANEGRTGLPGLYSHRFEGERERNADRARVAIIAAEAIRAGKAHRERSRVVVRSGAEGEEERAPGEDPKGVIGEVFAIVEPPTRLRARARVLSMDRRADESRQEWLILRAIFRARDVSLATAARSPDTRIYIRSP